MNRGRLKLLILIAVFVGPLAAASLWYAVGGAPRGAANHAPLLSPPLTLTPFTNTDADGDAFTLAHLRRKWSVVHIIGDGCDAACEKNLYHTRQTRIALGRDARRVQRIFISPSRALLTALAGDHPDAVLLVAPVSGHGAGSGGVEQQLPADTVLVDPLGNAMLVIPADLNPRLLLKDLKHLLKVSRIG